VTRDRVSIKLENGLDFDIVLVCFARKFAKLKSYSRSVTEVCVSFVEG